ncbi:MAG: hypothetical protein ACK5L3_14035, partial [Oscillospiraceae bacterium]
TNNDNDIYNALLNLPDKWAGSVLVEYDRYLIDANLGTDKGSDGSFEYYTASGKFFEIDQLSNHLSSNLASSSATTLRTDFWIQQDAFQNVLDSVASSLGTSVYAYYWLGVIYIYKV